MPILRVELPQQQGLFTKNYQKRLHSHSYHRNKDSLKPPHRQGIRNIPLGSHAIILGSQNARHSIDIYTFIPPPEAVHSHIY